MPLNSKNFQKLLEPRFRKVFFEGYKEKEEQYSKVFHTDNSKKAKEYDYHVAGVGLWPVKDPQGPVQYARIQVGEEAVYIHEEYSKGIQIERKLVDDEMYGVMDKAPKSLGKGARATVEMTAASIFNNGFTEVGYDGKTLFAEDHPYYGEEATGVGDNLMDLEFDAAGAALKAGLQLMKAQKDESALKIAAESSRIIAPDDLEFTVLTVLNSTQAPGGNYNDVNVVKGKVKPFFWTYLTDAKNWFLIDDDLHELWFFWRVRPEFKSEENFDTMVARYRGYLRFSCGWSNWRGLVGSNPAG
jgi:phage major head subunit gpT-like protein